MKKFNWDFTFSKIEQHYWINELKNNRRFFLLMYLLIIAVEVGMAFILFITNSISSLPNYDMSYFSFYAGGIINALFSIAIIYYVKQHVHYIQIICLSTLMIWACLFTIHDINMGSNGYMLSQIIVLSATSIRFPVRIHFTMHVAIFCLYIALLLTLDINSNLIASNIVNTGILFLFASLIIVYSNRIRIQNFKNTLIMEKQQKQLLYMTRFDGLTELYSRTTLLNILEKLFKEKASVACIMTDIDDFKKYNDLYGHRTGDKVLRHSATVLKQIIKIYGGKAGRYGGEEFLIVIEDCNLEKLKAVLEDIHLSFHEPADEHKVTLSIGGTLLKENDTIDSLISRADQAMYRAKNAGKHTFRIL